jgi:hypothetical protein
MRRVFLLFFLLVAYQAQAADYYVQAGGNDQNAGDWSHPWRSVAKVSQVCFCAGDQVFFAGGQTFPGRLLLNTCKTSGRPDAPITVGSYVNGTATRATITGGFEANDIGGVAVRDLMFTGNNSFLDGLAFYSQNTTGGELAYLRVRNVAVSGFTRNGIVVLSKNATAAHYADVEITTSTVHDVNNMGVLVYALPHELDYHQNVRISHLIVYNAVTNNGIALGSTRDGSVTDSNVYNCGWGSTLVDGPNGIITFDSTNVRLANNTVSYMSTKKNDGNGVVFDRNTRDSVMENNYSHHNRASAIYLAQCVTGGDQNFGVQCGIGIDTVDYHTGNIVRNNKTEFSACGICFWGRIRNVEIYGNSITQWKGKYASRINNAFLLPPMYVENVRFHDNVFTTQTGTYLVEISAATLAGVPAGSLRFTNNTWQAQSGFLIQWGNTTYRTLAAWTAATGNN